MTSVYLFSQGQRRTFIRLTKAPRSKSYSIPIKLRSQVCKQWRHPAQRSDTLSARSQAVFLSTQPTTNEVANADRLSTSKYIFDKLIAIACGLGLGYTLAGTLDFVFDFPKPLEITWDLCQANDEVKEAFGTPLSKSLFWDGNVTEFQASVTLPISGPRGDGSLVGRLIKDKKGTWIPLLIVVRKEKRLITVVDTSNSPRSFLNEV